MVTICKNCDNHFEGNFCNNCGQAAATHKMTMHFIWHDLQHGLFHFDNGIFYTIKKLLTTPGKTIREFIEGKRVRHFKPFTFVIVLATLYGVLYHYFIGNIHDIKIIHPEENVASVYAKVAGWITDHFAYASLIIILNTTIASFLVFKKQGYNFAEHFVLNIFYRGLAILINLMFLPVLYKYSHSEHLMNYVFIAQVIDFLLMYWCYVQFFNKIPKLKSLYLTLFTWLIMSGINTGIGYLTGWIIYSLS